MNRKELQKQYDAALAQVNKLELCSPTDMSEAEFELAYNAANLKLDMARKALVEAEIAQPTKSEMKKESHRLYLRSRGLDV